tara:strand:+ start:707 stop:907 length:201 start_codon:yes stop_codon:yes gene_type:complete
MDHDENTLEDLDEAFETDDSLDDDEDSTETPHEDASLNDEDEDSVWGDEDEDDVPEMPYTDGEDER